MPTSGADGQTVITWALGVLATILTMFGVGKHIMRTNESDKLVSAVVSSDITSYARLNADILRLAKDLQSLRRQLEWFQRKIFLLAALEAEAGIDLGSLTAYVQAMPCGNCGAPDAAFNHINVVMASIRARRKARNDIFTEEMPDEDAT